MRESLLPLFLIGGFVTVMFYGLTSTQYIPELNKPSASLVHSLDDENANASVSKSERGKNQGVYHAQGPNQGYFEQVTEFGEGQGSSAKTEESQSLYSIYQRKNEKKSGLRKQTESAQPDVATQLNTENKEKVVHGVPLETWVNSSFDQILIPAVTRDTAHGLRVFVQCLELKRKGPEYLKESECEALLVRHSNDRGSSTQY